MTGRTSIDTRTHWNATIWTYTGHGKETDTMDFIGEFTAEQAMEHLHYMYPEAHVIHLHEVVQTVKWMAPTAPIL